MTRPVRSGPGRAALLFGIALCALPAAAQDLTLPVAQTVTREKARLVLFDGESLTLERLVGSSGGESVAATEPRFSVAVTPQTRYVGTTAGAFADIKAGDFTGLHSSLLIKWPRKAKPYTQAFLPPRRASHLVRYRPLSRPSSSKRGTLFIFPPCALQSAPFALPLLTFAN